MRHTVSFNPCSEEPDKILSRIRPLSTLKALMDSVELHKYRTIFAMVFLRSRGEFTEEDVRFISISPEEAHYINIDDYRNSVINKGLENMLVGTSLFAITQDEAKELRAAELVSGCLKTALIHLVNGLEDAECHDSLSQEN